MNHKYGKLLSVFLSIALVLLLIPGAYAGQYQFAGDGTADMPYLISSAEDLSAFSMFVYSGECPSGLYFAITEDITLSSDFSFVPAGTQGSPFSGHLDGRSHTVSGINFTDYNKSGAGFFGYIESAEITGLNIASSVLDVKGYAGGIAGHAVNSVIADCTVSASIYADSFCGGIAGYAENSSLRGCEFKADSDIGGYDEYCGGIVGYSESEITQCVNSAFVSGTAYVGGIAGYSSLGIYSSINKGRVTASSKDCGGVAGLNEGLITLSYNAGAVGGVNNAGGIAGVNYEGSITESYNAGAVNATGDFSGGIVGYSTRGEVRDCYNCANVNSSAEYCAGLFGYSFSTVFSNCYNSGFVSGVPGSAAALGGLVNGETNNCYYYVSSLPAFLTGTGSDTDCATLSGAQMKLTESFADFDFDDVWDINGLHSYAYPTLRGINYHTLNFASMVPATCTADGYSVFLCSVCGNLVNGDFVPAFGHSFEKVSSLAPTCTDAGYADYICTVCSETYSENISATGHTDADSDGICDVCGEKLTPPDDKPGEDEMSIWEKIVSMINSFINWLKSIFKIG